MFRFAPTSNHDKLVAMQTVVRTPESQPPSTVTEVLAALRAQKLEPRHEAKSWGDWIYLNGTETVISIESMRGLATTATIEHAEDDSRDAGQAILAAFDKLGWVGVDEDGEYPLI